MTKLLSHERFLRVYIPRLPCRENVRLILRRVSQTPEEQSTNGAPVGDRTEVSAADWTKEYRGLREGDSTRSTT